MEKLKRVLVGFLSIFKNILWKIRNRGTGITVTYGTGWNPNFIGDQFMIMFNEFKKKDCPREYVIKCLPILDEAWDNIEKIVEPYEDEAVRYDIATSLQTALEEAHQILNVNPLKYTWAAMYVEMYKRARYAPCPTVLETLSKV